RRRGPCRPRIRIRQGLGEARSRCRVRPRRPATACGHLSEWQCGAKFVLARRKSKLLIDFSSCTRRALRIAPYDPGEHREADMQRLLAIIFGAALAALTCVRCF